MFPEVIRETSLYNDAANQALQYVESTTYGEDVSFASTLRALLKDRHKEGEVTSVMVGMAIRNAYDLASNSLVLLSNRSSDNHGRITIIDVQTPKEDPAWERIGEVFEGAGFEKNQKVTDLFIKAFRVDAYVREETRSVVIAVQDLSIKKYHYIQCSTLGLMPWYFNPSEGASDLELRLLVSLTKKDSREYLEVLDAFARGMDIRGAHIWSVLGEWESGMADNEIISTNRELEVIKGNLKSLLEKLSERYVEEEELNRKLLSLKVLKERSAEDQGQLAQMFVDLKPLHLVHAGSNYIKFDVDTTIDYFDEDLVRKIIDRESSSLYGGSNSPPDEDIKRFMTAVFIDQEISIRTYATFKIDVMSKTVGTRVSPNNPKFINHLPQPHIEGYGCLGSAEVEIVKSLGNGNVMGAIQQCLAATKNLNFGDATVTFSFASRIWGMYEDRKMVVLPDGSFVTTREAIAWLKGNEEASSEQDDADYITDITGGVLNEQEN